MTAQEILDSESGVRRQYEIALRERNAARQRVFTIKEQLFRLLETLSKTPCEISETPGLKAPQTLLEDLTALDRKLVVSACEGLRRARESVRRCEKVLGARSSGTIQTAIPIDHEEEDLIS